jgi:hypothetical protein
MQLCVTLTDRSTYLVNLFGAAGNNKLNNTIHVLQRTSHSTGSSTRISDSVCFPHPDQTV